MKRPNGFVLVVPVFICLGAIIAGYMSGAMSGILEMDGFKDVFSELYNSSSEDQGSSMVLLANNSQILRNSSSFCGMPEDLASDCGSEGGAGLIGLIVSAFNIGSIAGSLLGGWFSDLFSRKYGLGVSALSFIIGAAIIASSYHVWVLVIGRLLNGVGNGMIYAIMPVYLSEITPKDSRGMLGSITGPTYLGGYLLALITNVGYAKFSLGWRISMIVAAFGGLVYFIGLILTPHSPRWLVKKNRDQEALRILSKINRHSNEETFVDTYFELEELKESVSGNKHVVKEFFQKKYLYRLFIFVVILAMAPIAGISLISYSATIFCEVQIPRFLASLMLGIVILVASVLLLCIIDKVGRKSFFLTFLLLELITGFAMSILIHLCPTPGGAVAYTIATLICVYSFGYASWLVLPWVIAGEVFPTKIRGLMAGIATSVYWLASSLTNFATPLLINSIQLHGLFYIISSLNLFALVFILFILPETKGVSLEEMDGLFSQFRGAQYTVV